MWSVWSQYICRKQSSSWLYHKYYTSDRYIKRNILNTSDIIAYRSIPAFTYLAEQIANLASLNTKVIHVSTLIQKTAKLLSDWTLSDADWTYNWNCEATSTVYFECASCKVGHIRSKTMTAGIINAPYPTTTSWIKSNIKQTNTHVSQYCIRGWNPSRLKTTVWWLWSIWFLNTQFSILR